MCGIAGCISQDGKALFRSIQLMLNQLHRGTRGAGVAFVEDNKVVTIKAPSHPEAFAEIMRPSLADTNMAFAHNRMPSVGAVTTNNTHPFLSCSFSPTSFAFAHNGTYGSRNDTRKLLKNMGHKIKGETDSEVLAHIVCSLALRYKGKMRRALARFVDKFYSSGVTVSMTKRATYLTGYIPILKLSDGTVMYASDLRTMEAFMKDSYRVYYPDPVAVIRKDGVMRGIKPYLTKRDETDTANWFYDYVTR